MTRALDTDFVARYGRPPAKTTLEKAMSLHENVRALLGDVDYASVLQGSYKNDAALATMNDVDVLTVSRHAKHDWYRAPNWPEIFSGIERKLDSDRRYAGKWGRKDKCIRLSTEVSIHVVPAVHHGDPIADPVSVRAGVARPHDGDRSSPILACNRRRERAPSSAMAEPWVSGDEIARHLGVAKDTVYRWIEGRALPAHRVGRLWKFKVSGVDDWVRTGGASDPGPSVKHAS